MANRKYTELRSCLMIKGYTLCSWAREKKYPVTTVYSAAQGKRRGVKATRIIRELEGVAYGK